MAVGTIGSSAGTAVLGTRVASDIASGRQVPQVDPRVYRMTEDVTLLPLLLNNLGNTKKAANRVFQFVQGDVQPLFVVMSAQSTAGTTPLLVTAGHEKRVRKGDLLRSLRNNSLLMRVSADPTVSGQIPVTRPAGATTDATIESGDELIVAGHSAAEGTTAPSSTSHEPSLVSQALQEYKRTWTVSDVARGTEVYGEDEWQRQMLDNRESFFREMELAWLTGTGYSASDPWISKGLPALLTSNVVDVNGALTEDALIDDIRQFFQLAKTGKRLVIAGDNFVTALGKIARDYLLTSESTKFAGLSVMRYRTPFGDIDVLHHRLLSHVGSAMTASLYGLQGYAYFLNMSHIVKCNFAGETGPYRHYADIKKDDRPTLRKDEIAEINALEVRNEAQHVFLQRIS